MIVTTIRKLRANMKTYFNNLSEKGDILLIPRQSEQEAMVIMSLSEYNSLLQSKAVDKTPINEEILAKKDSKKALELIFKRNIKSKK